MTESKGLNLVKMCKEKAQVVRLSLNELFMDVATDAISASIKIIA